MTRFRKVAGVALLAALGTVGLYGQQLYVYAAGSWSTLPLVGQNSYCASTVSGVALPSSQGSYGIVPGSTQGTGSSICGQTVPAGPALTGNENVPADVYQPNAVTTAQGGAPQQTVGIASSILAGATWSGSRNYLGNGELLVTNTNGTGTVTCATTSALTTAALSADRWGCDANVASGVGRTAIATTASLLPADFANVMKVWRLSGALTQPVCTWQEVPTPSASQLAGQTVTFSAYLTALAGLAADNGNQVNMVVITGTSTDEGLNAGWTASPAITPAWTGIATAANIVQTITTTPTRYSINASIPATATEVGVGICFTPTATGAGATDGFAFTGAQLERAPGASLFEHRSSATEANSALQYYYKVTEGAVGSVRAPGLNSSTSLATVLLQFPVPMYKVPTMSYVAGFGACSAVACTAQTACTAVRTSTLQTGFAADVNRVPIDCTSSAGFGAAGTATFLMDDAGSGVITAWTGL